MPTGAFLTLIATVIAAAGLTVLAAAAFGPLTGASGPAMAALPPALMIAYLLWRTISARSGGGRREDEDR